MVILIHSCDTLTGLSVSRGSFTLSNDYVQGTGAVYVYGDGLSNDVMLSVPITVLNLSGMTEFKFDINREVGGQYVLELYAPDSANRFIVTDIEPYLGPHPIPYAWQWRQATIPKTAFAVENGSPDWSKIGRMVLRAYIYQSTQGYTIDYIRAEGTVPEPPPEEPPPEPPPEDVYYVLTVNSAVGGGAGTSNPVTGSHNYLEGSTATVSFIVAPNYSSFEYWDIDGLATSTDNPITVEMNASHTVTPHTSYNPPPDGNGNGEPPVQSNQTLLVILGIITAILLALMVKG